MAKLFGTDGIRGPADGSLAELAREVGAALARACREGALGPRSRRPRIVVGRDTRASGPTIEDALVGGLVGAGANALRAGVLPTPGVAHATVCLEADAGVVISASHNPPDDNGIKVFGPGGWKLSLEAEGLIEDLVGGDNGPSSKGTDELVDMLRSYVDHLAATVSADLAAARAVIDCANGATFAAAPSVLDGLGVEVIALNADGTGERINDACGATHPEVIAVAATSEGCIGLAFDGDGDRVVIADESGEIVDGDGILALIASDMRRRGELRRDAIACTVMSNQSLRRWCRTEGIGLVETPVGDRNVLDSMRSRGLVLGAEQAGHVIRLDHATTGDGILAGLGVLDIVARSGSKLSELVPFRPMPQVLVNVRVDRHDRMEDASGVRAAVDEVTRRLGNDGRVLVRPSGTEPIVRVMVEATDRDLAGEMAELVAAAVRREADGS